MPNVGFGEILVILLVALLVFGPQKLPEMMRGLGKALRAFQEESGRAVEQLRSAAEPGAREEAIASARPVRSGAERLEDT